MTNGQCLLFLAAHNVLNTSLTRYYELNMPIMSRRTSPNVNKHTFRSINLFIKSMHKCEDLHWSRLVVSLKSQVLPDFDQLTQVSTSTSLSASVLLFILESHLFLSPCILPYNIAVIGSQCFIFVTKPRLRNNNNKKKITRDSHLLTGLIKKHTISVLVCLYIIDNSQLIARALS